MSCGPGVRNIRQLHGRFIPGDHRDQQNLSSRRRSVFLPPSAARGKETQRGDVIISVPAVPEACQGSLPESFSGYITFYRSATLMIWVK